MKQIRFFNIIKWLAGIVLLIGFFLPWVKAITVYGKTLMLSGFSLLLRGGIITLLPPIYALMVLFRKQTRWTDITMGIGALGSGIAIMSAVRYAPIEWTTAFLKAQYGLYLVFALSLLLFVITIIDYKKSSQDRIHNDHRSSRLLWRMPWKRVIIFVGAVILFIVPLVWIVQRTPTLSPEEKKEKAQQLAQELTALFDKACDVSWSGPDGNFHIKETFQYKSNGFEIQITETVNDVAGTWNGQFADLDADKVKYAPPDKNDEFLKQFSNQFIPVCVYAKNNQEKIGHQYRDDDAPRMYSMMMLHVDSVENARNIAKKFKEMIQCHQ
ncbi:MAG: hypothetical protein HQK77_19320 [Desulfobacterales bacterium]|nr:hypothetical protein [Desulfobacterales bacterium]